MPTLLALGQLWVILIVAVPIVLIGMAIYSVWKLRKEENWEQQ
jgi:flagellar basal body-associated protein FliL